MRALALLGVLVALVAGCGANDPIAAEEISAAAQETAEAGSSRIELSGTDGGDVFTISGSADYASDKALFTYDGTTDGRREAGEVRLLGKTFYVRPDTEEGLTAGKPWFSATVTEEEREGGSGSLESLLFPFPFLEPTELLRTFESVSGNAARLGEKAIRGEPTEGYRLTLDLAKLIERADEADRDMLRADLARRSEKTVPVEIWVDRAARARRMTVPVAEGSTVTIDFFDFGVDVAVEAPPKDQVMDSSVFWEGEESGESEELPVQTIEEETP